ncbi:hypothetical protein K4F52_004879 [Lecanicillium sp. MT-2017a]|nr:hypothetical protein K4F52_004879 [Lecanicillium sp. MT-2017a]
MVNSYLLLAAAATAVAKVTVQVSDVKPLPLRQEGAVTSASDLWSLSVPEEAPGQTPYNASLLMSSYADFGVDDDGIFAPGTVYASSDSIVRGALEAWAQHQHLVLRPDEIWFEILAQMNFYMTTHAEQIRDLFVDFEGKKEIKVLRFTWRDVIAAFAGEIQKRVKTDWLLEWIMPGFTTSDDNDGMTATVLMMGLMQHYFTFTGGIICGLPMVTLQGERDDWARLLEKLDRLPEWGAEPAAYADNLRPILRRFVDTFDHPDSEDIKAFWNQIVRADRQFTCGSGPVEYDVTGWLMGFLHWNTDGTLRVPKPEDVRAGPDAVTLDGVTYVPQPMDHLPVGYAKAPLKMLDYPKKGVDSRAFLLAGNVGVNRTAAAEDGGYVVAQPMSSWFLFGPVEKDYKSGPGYGSIDELRTIYDGLAPQDQCPSNHYE